MSIPPKVVSALFLNTIILKYFPTIEKDVKTKYQAPKDVDVHTQLYKKCGGRPDQPSWPQPSTRTAGFGGYITIHRGPLSLTATLPS